jgi:predicted transcriptional regulator
MPREESLKLKARLEIYNFILKHPGLHLSELSRRLKMNKNNLDYHLRYLTNHGLITVSVENKYTTYYVKQIEDKRAETIANILEKKLPNETKSRINYILKYLTPNKDDRELLNLIRRKVPYLIIVVLYAHPNSSQRKISRLLKKHPTTVSFHLKKLVDKGIIEYEERGNENLYRIKDEVAVFRLLFLFASWTEQVDSDGKPTGKLDYSGFDSALERFYDIFPHPYHV